MPKLTLAERIERANQRELKAGQEKARLKEQQRKARNRRLIEIGGLAVKAGIDTLPATALYDRFLRIAGEAASAEKVSQWAEAGAAHFQREEDLRVIAVAKFADRISPELAASLRAIGFRWNRFVKQWEGKVEFDIAAEMVESQGGSIRILEEGAD